MISLSVKKFSHNPTRFCLRAQFNFRKCFYFQCNDEMLELLPCLYDYPPFFIQKKSKRKLSCYTVLCLCVYLIHFLGLQFAAVNDDNSIITFSVQFTFLYFVFVTDCLNCVQNSDYVKQAIKLISTYNIIYRLKNKHSLNEFGFLWLPAVLGSPCFVSASL